MSDQQEVIFPQGIEIEVGGEKLVIQKFKFGQLPKVMKAVKSIAGPAIAAVQSTEGLNIEAAIDVFAQGGEDLIELMAECLGKPVSFINDLDPDEGITLVSAFFEVNADFFIKKVLPQVKDMIQKKQAAGLK